MSYGRLYCLEVDHALARGFSPEIQLGVTSIKSSGDDCCEFVYHGAKLTATVEPKGQTVMPWEYHLGHLYKTMGQVLVQEMGDAGEAALREALADFAAVYGQEAAGVVEANAGADFDQLPPDGV
jgi:hypothetical protein